jgi:hypothetical protein
MWSLETLDFFNREAARKARNAKREPYVPVLDEIAAYPPFPFPHLGPFVPPGWEQVEDATWFVDSSGWGQPGEPALAVEQFKDELRQYVSENPDHGFGIVEYGQFQCYVGAYRLQATTEAAA